VNLPANLPAGLTARPLTLDDAAAVTELIVAEELHDVGQVDVAVEDVVSEWQRPSYDVASSSLGVFDGDRLVAYADLVHPDFGYTGVLPTERGRGIGTALADWLEGLARSRGAGLLSNQVPQSGPAHRLLAARGYRERWTAWDLELPEGAQVAAQPLADGYALRDARPEDHEVIETAFGEWRDRGSLEDFAGTTAAAAWPPRCWRTRSGWPGRTARSAATSRPTRGPARSASTRRSAWSSPRPGSTSRPTSDLPPSRARRCG